MSRTVCPRTKKKKEEGTLKGPIETALTYNSEKEKDSYSSADRGTGRI